MKRPGRSNLSGAVLGAVILALAAGGCGAGISKEVLNRVDQDLTFRQVLDDPQRYSGRMVVFSGTILETRNTEKGAVLTILQHPARPGGRPQDPDRSEGRFLAEDKRFLDPAVYEPGRTITVAGPLTGRRTMALGDIEYDYPVMQIEELHLWRPRWPMHWGFFFSTHF